MKLVCFQIKFRYLDIQKNEAVFLETPRIKLTVNTYIKCVGSPAILRFEPVRPETLRAKLFSYVCLYRSLHMHKLVGECTDVNM